MSLQPTWDGEQRKETATPVTAHAKGRTHTDHVVCVVSVSQAACLDCSTENRRLEREQDRAKFPKGLTATTSAAAR